MLREYGNDILIGVGDDALRSWKNTQKPQNLHI